MEMVLQFKFGTGRGAEADAKEVLVWAAANWADQLTTMKLYGVKTLRFRAKETHPLEAILQHVLKNYQPGPGFEAVFLIKVN